MKVTKEMIEAAFDKVPTGRSLQACITKHDVIKILEAAEAVRPTHWQPIQPPKSEE